MVTGQHQFKQGESRIMIGRVCRLCSGSSLGQFSGIGSMSGIGSGWVGVVEGAVW